MNRTPLIILASVLGTGALAEAALAQAEGAQTFDVLDTGLLPADTDSFRVVTGFAQSFVVTVAGTLTAIEIQADWKPGSADTAYGWRIWAVEPYGTILDGGQFIISPSTPPGSGPWLVSATVPIAVAAGDVLVFALRQTSLSAVGEAELDWWVGDAQDVYDSYGDGVGFLRDGATNTYLTGEEDPNFGVQFDMRLRALVDVPVVGPCASDDTGPNVNTQLSIEVPVGTTQVTITGGAEDDSLIASVTVGGQLATLTHPGPSFAATVPVVGPDPVELTVIVTDECGNGTIRLVTVSFVEVCAPEFEMCMDGNAGTVFWIDLVDPTGTTCQLQCSTDAIGQGLACASTPVCPP